MKKNNETPHGTMTRSKERNTKTDDARLQGKKEFNKVTRGRKGKERSDITGVAEKQPKKARYEKNRLPPTEPTMTRDVVLTRANGARDDSSSSRPTVSRETQNKNGDGKPTKQTKKKNAPTVTKEVKKTKAIVIMVTKIVKTVD